MGQFDANYTLFLKILKFLKNILFQKKKHSKENKESSVIFEKNSFIEMESWNFQSWNLES
jgi:hypothetical protein